MAVHAGATGGSLERLLAFLALERIDVDVFRGEPGEGTGRLFGGLVGAQAAVAASRSAPGRRLHSVHAYFLLPGRHGTPIDYAVDRVRDGRTFASRRVVARQNRAVIFHLSASFTASEEGLAHQADGRPEAPGPDDVRDWDEAAGGALGGGPWRPGRAIEFRPCDPPEPSEPFQRSVRLRWWMRPRGALPEDPVVHAGVLLFASDYRLLGTAARAHGLPRSARFGASLDHAVWLHRPPRFDDWILVVAESSVSHGGRAWVLGRLFTRAGARIATVAQEGLVRAVRSR